MLELKQERLFNIAYLQQQHFVTPHHVDVLHRSGAGVGVGVGVGVGLGVGLGLGLGVGLGPGPGLGLGLGLGFVRGELRLVPQPRAELAAGAALFLQQWLG